MRKYTIISILFSITSIISFSQTNVSGVISTNTTWTKANSPYNITGNTQISAGVTLTIDPGVRVVFTGDYSFKAFGPIISVGTASDSIYFDTNSSVVKIGKGIYIRSTATANFDVNYNYLSGSRFKYCSFNNLARGIFNHESGVSIENCGFYNNDIAWEPRSNLQTLVSNSVFKKNNYALFTYGEDQTTGDNVACIKDILINSNEFNENGYGVSIGMNQRTVSNFKVTNNKFYKNTTIAVSIGGGGYGPYVGDNVEISSNKFIENANAVTAQVYNLGYNGCTGDRFSNNELLITKNTFYKDQNAVNLNGIAYANVTKNVFDSNQRGVYIGTNSDRRSDNTIQINQFFKVEKPVVIYANGIYYQTDNNHIKWNTFQSFLLNQSNPLISINTRVNNNRLTENNFSLYNGLIISNTDIGNVPFSGNYTIQSRTLANDINDQNDNIDLGLVQVSSASNSLLTAAPVSMPTDIVKSIVNGRLVVSWTNGSVSDFSGSKIYYGGYTGYSYTNVIDAGTASTYTLPAGVSIDEDIAVTNYDASADGTDDQYDGSESWYSPANKAPAQVSISSITPTERQIQLNWAAVSNANKYIIYKSTDSSTFTQLTTTTSTSYIDQNLNTLQQRYYYKISAFDSLDLSYTNYGLEGTASLIKGAKPTNKPTLSSIISYTDSIKLNFSYNSNLSGINAVKVYRASATESRAVVATLTSTATTYTDNVTSDKQYTYDVTITNTTDESDASASSTGSAFSIPVLSTTFHNKFDFSASDTLKWIKNALATKYQFQIDTVTTFNSAALITSNPTDTFYANTSLTKNKYLYWRVRSGDNNGYSTWSDYYTSQIAQNTTSIDSIVSLTGQIRLRFSRGNYLGVDSIYVYRKTSADARAIIARLGSGIATYTDDVSNGVYYTYDIAVKNVNDISKASSVKTASAFSIPSILSPASNQLDVKPEHVYKFSKPVLSTKYSVEYDTVNTFNSGAYQIKSSTDTSFSFSSLIQNQNYFMRVKAGDDNGFSSWSETYKFQTYVKEATLDTIIAANKTNKLKYTLPSSKRIDRIYILRDTIASPITVIDSIAGDKVEYLDTSSLKLNTKYYYKVYLKNTDKVQSQNSNAKFGVPFNLKPKVTSLANKSFSSVGEYNTVRTNYSASGSTDADGKIVSYKWYVNDSLVSSTDTILIYYYPHGTNTVKLLITDNDGDKDSVSTTVTLKSFVKKFTGGILGGIAALSPDILYVADTTFDAVNGASISRLDRSGNTSFGLVVSSKIFTTPSVSQDSSVFITSGSNLNGFTKSGAPLWPTIPLGGLSQVTPTVDSVLGRIYVGVANKNFFAIDYKAGKVIWSVQCDAPINASAVITGDRKLVFVSQNGTLYGFDIRGDSVLTKATWQYALGETIAKSAAVDDSSNLYFGTVGGKLIKLKLNRDGSVTKYWTRDLSAAIETSPVIDANGYVYIGTKTGKFVKTNPSTGEIIWEYTTTGSIKSTPALTDFGTIVLATTNGQIVALDTSKNVKWVHKEESPISANLLYIQNMVYIGTEAGNLIALYDNPNTNTVNTSLSKVEKNKMGSIHGSLANANENLTFIDLGLAKQKNLSTAFETIEPKNPVWGTFQGNYRRTGSKPLECPAKPTLNKSGTITICNGENVELTTSAIGNSSWVIDGQETTDAETKLLATKAGVYKRIAKNDNGCKIYSEEVTIKVNESPTKPTAVASSKTTFCEGESVQLNSSSSINNSWYRVGQSTVKGTLQGLTVDSTGSYFAKVTLSNGCTSNSDTIKVTVNSKPSIPVITYSTKEICSGDSVKLSIQDYYNTQWYSSGLAIDKANNNFLNVKNAGLYSVKVTSKEGCTTNSSGVDITVKPSTEIPSITPIGLPTICEGGSLLLTTSINANTIWYKNGTKVGTGQFLTVTDSGFYKVTAMRTNMCMSQSDSLQVTVNKIPNKPTVSRVQSDLVSSNSAGNQWYLNNEKINGATSQIFKPLQSGNYKVKTILNGCESALSENYYYLTTAISNLSNDEFVTVSPNPTNGYLRLAFTLRSLKTVELFIHDMSGNAVLVDRKAINGSSYHLDKFSSGNYVLVLKDKQGKVLYTQKIIKN